MSATKDIAYKLEAWAASVSNPALNTYPEKPEDLGKSFPLVVCDIQRRRKVAEDSDMSQYQNEQRDVRVWTARLTVMVEPGGQAQVDQLYDITDQLETSLTRDRTLGQRVEASSPEVDVEFPGEVEHSSGVVALAAFFQIIVGESAEVT